MLPDVSAAKPKSRSLMPEPLGASALWLVVDLNIRTPFNRVGTAAPDTVDGSVLMTILCHFKMAKLGQLELSFP